MERKTPEIADRQSPESQVEYPNTFSQPEISLMFNPWSANHRTSDEDTIESALSRLSLSNGYLPAARKASFSSVPSTIDAFTPPEFQTESWGNHNPWAWTQSEWRNCNGGSSGPFGYSGAHGEARVDLGVPDSMGGFPYVDGEAQLLERKMAWYTKSVGDYGCSFLHGKEPRSLSANGYSPVSQFLPQGRLFLPRLHSYGSQTLTQAWNRPTCENMRGNLVELVKTRRGCDFFSSILDDGLSVDEIDMILQEMKGCFSHLILSQFGASSVLMLFRRCNEVQRTAIIVELTENQFESTCISEFGSRALQNLLEMIVTRQHLSLILNALIPVAISLSMNINGHHVIQWCFKNLPREYLKDLLTNITSNCFAISISQSGCCVIQCCLENTEGRARENLIGEIIANALDLSVDPYGNYVVQRLVDMKILNVTEQLVSQCRGRFMSLSRNKFASNVVEKFLIESGEVPRTEIIRELVFNPDFSNLLTDRYGNYVIQTALSVSQGHTRTVLVRWIRGNMGVLQGNVIGQKILASIEKLVLKGA